VEHPEGVYADLNGSDDRIWSLKMYAECLRNWDALDRCLTVAQRNLADEQSAKNALRYEGLLILRDVDNGEDK
jgi:hypothetical protein